MRPLTRLALVASGAGLMVSTSLAASSQKSDQAHEYAEARKIALKDPKVQAAYAKADEKLNDRIIEIDPSLKPYVDKQKGTASPAKPAPATKAKQPAPAKKSAPAASTGTTHTVASGETLSSIALHYKVSVASLKSANSITDDRKLRVGQKLTIPAAKSTSAAKKSEPGFWDKLQSSF